MQSSLPVFEVFRRAMGREYKQDSLFIDKLSIIIERLVDDELRIETVRWGGSGRLDEDDDDEVDDDDDEEDREYSAPDDDSEDEITERRDDKYDRIVFVAGSCMIWLHVISAVLVVDSRVVESLLFSMSVGSKKWGGGSGRGISNSVKFVLYTLLVLFILFVFVCVFVSFCSICMLLTLLLLVLLLLL